MTRLARFLTLAAVVALIAGLPLPPAAHAQKAFKMGAIVPVSGPAAAFGLGVQRGMELAAEDIVLAFAELKDPVRERLRRYGALAHLPDELIFPTVGAAVSGYLRATGESWIDWEDTGGKPAGAG